MIRPATPLDAGPVAQILSEFIDTTPWMPRIHSRAEDLAHCHQMIDRGWVQVIGAPQITGFIARDGAAIHALYVAAPARGQGLGSALLSAAQAGASLLRLWTFQANAGAQRFYAGHGFSELRRTDGTGNDENLPDIQFTWAAPQPALPLKGALQ